MPNAWKSPLHQTTKTTKTEIWNDSCSIPELTYALEHGAVGATTNPVIVSQVLKKELGEWMPRIKALMADLPKGTEEIIAWKIIEEMAVRSAKMLQGAFEASHGKNGRISIQTNPKLYRDAGAMVEQAVHFHGLFPNNNVKMPATEAGMAALEEATYRGVSINSTVSFTLPQAIQSAEAVERGLERRRKDGKPIEDLSPICTIMVGRLDDWLKKIAEVKGIILEPGHLEWAGVAVMKKAYGLFKSRGYRSRLLAAAYRNHHHWSQFIGGDLSLTIPYEWQLKFNSSDVEVKNRMDDPVDPDIVRELSKKFIDFNRAYDEKGLIPKDFDGYGATRRTLRSFIAGYDDLLRMVRDIMLADPDQKGE